MIDKPLFIKKLCIIICILVIAPLLLIACSSSKEIKSLRGGMRDAASQVSELFSLMWQPEAFEAKKNHKKIVGNLETLIEDFHTIEEMAQGNPSILDPGFAATIKTHQGMLTDALRRFKEGKKDYAAWRLRGLTENCMACHTRHHVSLEYFGQLKGLEVEGKDSFESQLAAADFLVASRQFSKGANSLFELAEHARENRDFYSQDEIFQALAHWLIVEVRSLKDYSGAVSRLSTWGIEDQRQSIESELIISWIEDLEALAEDDYSITVAYAIDLLEPALKEDSYEGDRVNLVKTLRASAMLHELLMKPLALEERRAATFNLAVAYMHIPLPFFDTWREIYLEKTIRQFPGSEEAAEAFYQYDRWIKQSHTGSSGLHMGQEEVEKLNELKNIAFSKMR